MMVALNLDAIRKFYGLQEYDITRDDCDGYRVSTEALLKMARAEHVEELTELRALKEAVTRLLADRRTR